MTNFDNQPFSETYSMIQSLDESKNWDQSWAFFPLDLDQSQLPCDFEGKCCIGTHLARHWNLVTTRLDSDDTEVE